MWQIGEWSSFERHSGHSSNKTHLWTYLTLGSVILLELRDLENSSHAWSFFQFLWCEILSTIFFLRFFKTMLKHQIWEICLIDCLLQRWKRGIWFKWIHFLLSFYPPAFPRLAILHTWYKFELNVDKQSMGNLTFSLSLFSAPESTPNPIVQ